MPSEKTRVIIDTNLWISFLITGNFSRFDPLIEKSIIEVVYSKELLREFLEVTSRSKYKYSISRSDIINLLKRLHSCSTLIEVQKTTFSFHWQEMVLRIT